MLKRILSSLKRLHTDEQGADMVEYVLIVAAVALPLLAVVIWFWRDISMLANQWWTSIKGTSGNASGETNPGDLSHN